jgi:hypothetical protein
MRVTFLAPRLPPAVCGVADHTQKLAEAMAEQGVEVGFIHTKPNAAATARLPGPVEYWDGSRRSLADLLKRQRADWLWVQLSGYGYSRWGAPFALGQAISRALRRMPELRVAVCAHETYCSARQLGLRGPIVAPWQRFTVARIARSAHVIFSSNPGQWEQISSECGGRGKTVLLPIGSNIPAFALTAAERDSMREIFGWKPHEVVAATFGSWGMQIRAFERHIECLGKAMELGKVHRLACVGGDSVEAPLQLQKHARVGPLAGRLTIFGRRDAAEVAGILGCCDLGLVQPLRPVMCKSGGFVAMAVNGLPVLTAGTGDPGHGLNDLPGCLTAERFLSESPSQAELAAWGDELRQFAGRRFGWDAIAASALEMMCGNGERGRVQPPTSVSVGQ